MPGQVPASAAEAQLPTDVADNAACRQEYEARIRNQPQKVEKAHLALEALKLCSPTVGRPLVQEFERRGFSIGVDHPPGVGVPGTDRGGFISSTGHVSLPPDAFDDPETGVVRVAYELRGQLGYSDALTKALSRADYRARETQEVQTGAAAEVERARQVKRGAQEYRARQEATRSETDPPLPPARDAIAVVVIPDLADKSERPEYTQWRHHMLGIRLDQIESARSASADLGVPCRTDFVTRPVVETDPSCSSVPREQLRAELEANPSLADMRDGPRPGIVFGNLLQPVTRQQEVEQLLVRSLPPETIFVRPASATPPAASVDDASTAASDSVLPECVDTHCATLNLAAPPAGDSSSAADAGADVVVPDQGVDAGDRDHTDTADRPADDEARRVEDEQRKADQQALLDANHQEFLDAVAAGERQQQERDNPPAPPTPPEPPAATEPAGPPVREPEDEDTGDTDGEDVDVPDGSDDGSFGPDSAPPPPADPEPPTDPLPADPPPVDPPAAQSPPVDPRYGLGYTEGDIYREDHPQEFEPPAPLGDQV